MQSIISFKAKVLLTQGQLCQLHSPPCPKTQPRGEQEDGDRSWGCFSISCSPPQSRGGWGRASHPQGGGSLTWQRLSSVETKRLTGGKRCDGLTLLCSLLTPQFVYFSSIPSISSVLAFSQHTHAHTHAHTHTHMHARTDKACRDRYKSLTLKRKSTKNS